MYSLGLGKPLDFACDEADVCARDVSIPLLYQIDPYVKQTADQLL